MLPSPENMGWLVPVNEHVQRTKVRDPMGPGKDENADS
jgi:hypothetical protein